MRKTAIKKDKRTRLQKNFQQVVLKLYRKKPIDAISINEVCDKVGVPRSSFYYHYNTIRDVLEEIEKDFIKELIAAFETTEKTNLEGEELFAHLFEASIPVIKANESFIKAVLLERQDFSFVNKWSKTIADRIKPQSDGLREKVIGFTSVVAVGDMLAVGTPLTKEKGRTIFRETEHIYQIKKALYNN